MQFSLEFRTIPIENGSIVENPFWDHESNSLYFADLASNYLFRYDYYEGKLWSATIDGIAGAQSLIPMKDCGGHFAVAILNTMYKVKWDGRSSKATIDKKIFTIDDGTTDKIHVAIAAPNACEFIGGTYSPSYCSAHNQSAFSYTSEYGVRYFTKDLQVTTGFVYSCSTNRYYRLDGCTRQIVEYKWNPLTKELGKI